MRKETLRVLRCPRCGSPLEVSKAFIEHADDLTYAVLRCTCRKYPVVEGIPVLRSDLPTQKATKAITELRSVKALRWLVHSEVLERFAKGSLIFANKAFPTITREIPSVALVLSNMVRFLSMTLHLKDVRGTENIFHVSFSQAARRLFRGSTSEYFIHRFSSQSLWSVIPFLPLMKSIGPPVLDLGCGTGHLEFFLSRYFAESKIYGLDQYFLRLLLAKQYLSNSEYVCIDTPLLPFSSNFFKIATCVDAFHYISDKYTLTNELTRILKPEGILILTHVHNALRSNLSSGEPLTTEGYRSLFRGSYPMMFSEEKVLANFIYHDKIDLTTEDADSDLAASNALIIVVGSNSVSPKFEGLKKEFLSFKRRVRINPLYALVRSSEGKVLIRRSVPTRNFRLENPLSLNYMPEECELKKSEFHALMELDTSVNKNVLNKLMARFVALDLPPNY